MTLMSYFLWNSNAKLKIVIAFMQQTNMDGFKVGIIIEITIISYSWELFSLFSGPT